MKFNSNSFALAMPCLIAIFAAFFSASVMAQYVWLDAAGRKVFSDQPPPPSIAAKRILQQPGKAPTTTPVTATEEPATADGEGKPKTAEAPKTAPAPKIVSKDKDLEVAKKKADDEAAAKKKAEDEVRSVAKADNCERAKRSKIGLASGARIAQINAKGEREVMDDAAKMVETKRIEGIIAADCK